VSLLKAVSAADEELGLSKKISLPRLVHLEGLGELEETCVKSAIFFQNRPSLFLSDVISRVPGKPTDLLRRAGLIGLAAQLGILKMSGGDAAVFPLLFLDFVARQRPHRHQVRHFHCPQDCRTDCRSGRTPCAPKT